MMNKLLLILLGLTFICLLSAVQAVVELSSEELYAGIQNGDYDIVIDVRTQTEWDDGHIENATLVVDLALGGEERYQPILGCKECVIAVYCRSGSRARAAANVLEAAGFNAPVYNGQGVSQWTVAGYPLVTTASFEPECLTNEYFFCSGGAGGGEEKEDVIELTSEEFNTGIQNGDYDIIIDVRTQAEWDAGHIDGATLVIDLALGGFRYRKIEDCVDTCSIAVYCRSGSRARVAANFLATLGFTTPIYNGQGVSQWVQAGYPLVNTPSFEPDCLKYTDYTCPDSGGGGGGGGVCFSGDMEVQVKDKGAFKMKDLRVGDQVLVRGENMYEPIYSLSHFDPTRKAQFLQLLPSGLELTEDHMVFVESKGAIPAKMVQVGDKLISGGRNETFLIEKVKTVTRRGIFAPFTKSGTIVVNGVVASTFIAFQSSDKLMIGSFTTPFSYQWLARTFQLPQYWFERRIGNNESGDFVKIGMSSWIARPFELANWLLNDQKQSAVTMIIVFAPMLAVLMIVSFVDMAFTNQYAFAVIVMAVGSFFTLRRSKVASRTDTKLK